MNKRVVVCDELGRAPAVCLPVAEELLSKSQALEGYFFKAWGAGEKFNFNHVEHGCPMALWVRPGIPVLHWVARVVPDRRGLPPSGTLRLVTNPNQPGAIGGGLSALANSTHVNLDALGLPDEGGGYVVSGQLGVLVQGEALIGLRLQGVCQNVRVLWSAVSQAHLE